MDLELHDRRALVTGASRGIGRAIAQRLAAAGATVVVTARSVDKAVVAVTIHDAETRKQNFGMVSKAFVRVVNQGDNSISILMGSTNSDATFTQAVGSPLPTATTPAGIVIAKTALSYGYTQPAQEGKFFNMYHGFMEAVPVTANSSKMVYTLFVDESDKADQAAKDADIASRRTRFEAALKKMKELSEAK